MGGGAAMSEELIRLSNLTVAHNRPPAPPHFPRPLPAPSPPAPPPPVGEPTTSGGDVQAVTR